MAEPDQALPRSAPPDGGIQVRLEPETTHPTLLVRTPDGLWLRANNASDPVAEADQLVATAFTGGDPHTIIVVGLGLGYVLDAIERRSTRTRVLAIEPVPAALPLMFQRRNWSTWTEMGRLAVLAGPKYDGAARAFRRLDGRGAPPPVFLHPVLKRAYPREVARGQRLAEHIVSGARANDEARRKFAGPYLLNTLENLPTLCSEGDVSALFDALTGVPAIVVAAGPSLDTCLDQLRLLQDQAVLIAVDTALRPLLAAGIRPHVVVAVDPQEANAKHLSGMTDTDGVFLVAEGSLHASAFPPFVGRTFCFKVSPHQPWPWLATCGVDRGTLQAWGSVLTTAFDLACRMGCDPVIFAGADLAYTDGRTYCRNTIYDWPASPLAAGKRRDAVGTVNGPTTKEPDVRGGVTLSAPRFAHFRDWLVARATEAAPRRVVNGTGAGILRGGRIEQAPLASLNCWNSRDGVSHVRRRLAGAWDSSRPGATVAARRLEEALASSDRSTVPLEQWVEFAGDGASPSRIGECLDHARLLLGGWDDRADGRAVLPARAATILENAARAGRVTPNLAEAYRVRGLLELAEAAARAMYARPDCTRQDVLSRVAIEHGNAGRRERALALLKDDYRLGRQTAGRTVLLLQALLDGEQTDDARSVLSSLSPAVLPSDADRYTYALALARLDRVDEGEALMREIYARNAGFRNGLSLVGWQHRKAGRHEHAAVCLRDDYAMKRQTPGWTVNYVIQLLDLKRPVDAGAVMATLSADQIGSFAGIYAYAIALARLDRIDEGEALMREVYARHAGVGNGLSIVGWQHRKAGRHERAAVCLRDDYAMARQTPDWTVNYVIQLLDLKRSVDADAVMDTLSAEKIGSFAGIYAYAICLARLGRWGDAESVMTRVYAQDASAKDGFARLGWTRTEFKDWHGALALMERDRTSARLSPAWRVNLALMLGRTGEFAAAQTHVEEAYRGDPGVKDGFAKLGWIKAAAKDWPGALALMERDLREERLSPAWAVNVAQALARQGRFAEGVALVEDAYRKDATLVDGFARLGWAKAEAADWRGAVKVMERDFVAGRITPLWQVNRAMAVACVGADDTPQGSSADPAAVASVMTMRDSAWTLPARFDPTTVAAFADCVAEARTATSGASPQQASALFARRIGQFVDGWHQVLGGLAGDTRQRAYSFGRARLRELLIDREWPEAVAIIATGQLAGTPRRDGQPLMDDELDTYFGDLVALVAGVPGDIAEFGVFKGFSLSAVARHAPDRQIWGFDSWKGLPAFTHHDEVERPAFRGEGSLAASKEHVAATFANAGLGLSNIRLIDGWFQDTIDRLGTTPLALVNLDADLYESCRLVLETVWPLLSPGGIISLDEYNEPYFPGARMAVDEFLSRDEVRNHYRLQRHASVDRYYLTKK